MVETKQKEQKKPMVVKCPKCGHIFMSRSKLGLVSCADCGAKFKKDDHKVKSYSS